MDSKKLMDIDKQYLNPYFGGVLLGLLLLVTFYISGRGLGATGAVKTTIVTAVDKIVPKHAESSNYYSRFLSDDKHPMNNWLSFETLGILAGAFLSGAIGGRLKLKVEYSPKITSRTRLIAALLGGILFGIGSQFGRGCTSGAALSGSGSLALGGFIAMAAIFGSGYMFAWFLRKLWI